MHAGCTLLHVAPCLLHAVARCMLHGAHSILHAACWHCVLHAQIRSKTISLAQLHLIVQRDSPFVRFVRTICASEYAVSAEAVAELQRGAAESWCRCWSGWRTRSRCRCGRGEPGLGAHAAGASPVLAQMWQGLASPVLVEMRQGRAQS